METLDSESLEQMNARLAEVSKGLFGDSMCLMAVDPKSLTLLKENARFFKRESFRQLRDNVQSDKRLSSSPLCYRLDDGSLEVLSGNHRVKAACEAGLERIVVLVILERLTKEKRIAIQLSHNALVGEDDASILASLWEQLGSMEDRLYTGLDSEMMKELDEVELVNFSTPSVPAKTTTFMFTDAEQEHLDEILDKLAACAKASSAVYLSPGANYERFVKLVKDIKHTEKIRDSSLAMARILEIVEGHLVTPIPETQEVAQ